jgi:hypothetical protein
LKKVKVRILLACKNNLPLESKADFEKTKALIQKLQDVTNKTAFVVKYYEHEPIISMVVADDECLVGPVFPKISSKHTTTIHAKSNGTWAEGHIKYFEDEWTKAKNP